MAPLLADLLKEPKGPLPSTMEALTQAEVANPSSLPFAQAASDGSGEDLRKEFTKVITGMYVKECGEFFLANKVPLTPTGQLIYMVARLVKGESFVYNIPWSCC